MPTHEAAQRRLLAALTPNLPVAEAVLDGGFLQVLEAVNRTEGPAAFVGWSLGGGMGQAWRFHVPTSSAVLSCSTVRAGRCWIGGRSRL
jgi:hypothetical protein